LPTFLQFINQGLPNGLQSNRDPSGYSKKLSRKRGWGKLKGFRQLANVINGVKIIDGIDKETVESQRNAA
jgi:hypothetical protein